MEGPQPPTFHSITTLTHRYQTHTFSPGACSTGQTELAPLQPGQSPTARVHPLTGPSQACSAQTLTWATPVASPTQAMPHARASVRWESVARQPRPQCPEDTACLLYTLPRGGCSGPSTQIASSLAGRKPLGAAVSTGEYLHQGKQQIRIGFSFFFFFPFSPESQFTSIPLSHPEPRIQLFEPKQQLSATGQAALPESLSLRRAWPARPLAHVQSRAPIGPTRLSGVQSPAPVLTLTLTLTTPPQPGSPSTQQLHCNKECFPNAIENTSITSRSNSSASTRHPSVSLGPVSGSKSIMKGSPGPSLQRLK